MIPADQYYCMESAARHLRIAASAMQTLASSNTSPWSLTEKVERSISEIGVLGNGAEYRGALLSRCREIKEAECLSNIVEATRYLEQCGITLSGAWVPVPEAAEK